MTIVVMSYMNEWERTIEAIEKHAEFADGAGGVSIAVFWMTRRELFPAEYKQYKRQNNL
ncbi:MAG: hypothetical protein ACI9E1_001682 [Cryomorphaceae bacterium]|jgi:hypothetical protein